MLALRDTGMLSKWQHTAAVQDLEISALAWIIRLLFVCLPEYFSNSIHFVGFHLHNNLDFLSVDQLHVRRAIAQHYMQANKPYLCLGYIQYLVLFTWPSAVLLLLSSPVRYSRL